MSYEIDDEKEMSGKALFACVGLFVAGCVALGWNISVESANRKNCVGVYSTPACHEQLARIEGINKQLKEVQKELDKDIQRETRN